MKSPIFVVVQKVTLLMSKQTPENLNKHQVLHLAKSVASGGFCTAGLPTSLCFNHLLSRLLQLALKQPQSLSTILLPFHKFKTIVSNKSLKGLVFSFYHATYCPSADCGYGSTAKEGHSDSWQCRSSSTSSVTLSSKSYRLSQISPLSAALTRIYQNHNNRNIYHPCWLAGIALNTRHGGLSNRSGCFYIC